MAADKFTIETPAGKLLCVKVFTNTERYFLYILPHNSARKGFFMTRGNRGDWEILYKILVDKSILEIEPSLSGMIEEALNNN